MSWNYPQIFKLFEENRQHELFLHSKHGLEKECLRVNNIAELSQQPHPNFMGSSLTHPYISTDFSEAQLEFITSTFNNEKKAIQHLKNLQKYTFDHMKKEWMWPFSSPCLLPKAKDIPLADYGSSKLGEEKKIYRRGLGFRYGRKMQTMSGIHYNFSFSEDFFRLLHNNFDPDTSLQEFINKCYFKIMRNFLRWGWINAYFFGASPAVDRSYFDKPCKQLSLMRHRTLYGEYTTSIRMSALGYYSRVQAQYAISFNDLSFYLQDMKKALSTSSSTFKTIGLFKKNKHLQLNHNVLQIEAEHYSRIRPKAPYGSKLSSVEALKNEGVSFIEIRAVDLDPFDSVGVTEEQLHFLHVLIIDCLFQTSSPITETERKEICYNQNRVTLEGRNPKLKLKKNGKSINFRTWAMEIMNRIEKTAKLLDLNHTDNRYISVLKKQKEKLNDVSLTPSYRIMQQLQKEKISFKEFGLKLAKKHKRASKQYSIPPSFEKEMEKWAVDSNRKQQELEYHDDMFLSGFEDMEISTQMIIREVQNRGIDVTVLDRGDNFIRLKRGSKTELIKQGTKTSKDSLISYLIMENKSVTKQLLREKGLQVPCGRIYYDQKKAFEDYSYFSKKKIVVKPNSTNYGLGISFVNPNSEKEYTLALEKAFKLSDDVLVENFCIGKEYRVLVIDYKVVAVCLREPPHVVGDGIHTIGQLIHKKNFDPNEFKIPKYRIQMGDEESSILKEQGFTFKSIPKKNEKALLRKNSNVSTGGDPVDMTDLLHDDYCQLAIEATRIVRATFCGVDIIIKNPTSKKTSKNHSIIELNFNPALFLHRYPNKGEKRYVEKDVLDALGF